MLCNSRVSESRIIRDAIGAHTDAILADRLDYQMADLIGTVAGDQPNAHRAHEAFGELLHTGLRQKRRQPRRRRGSKSPSSVTPARSRPSFTAGSTAATPPLA